MTSRTKSQWRTAILASRREMDADTRAVEADALAAAAREIGVTLGADCLLYTSPSPRDS